MLNDSSACVVEILFPCKYLTKCQSAYLFGMFYVKKTKHQMSINIHL